MSRRYNEKQVHRANCNGVIITVMKCWAVTEPEEHAYFLVNAVDSYDEDGWEPDPLEFETEAEAKKAFDELVEEYQDKPNWNAQAVYDEAHGTINGEDPGIVMMRELGW